MFKGSPIYGNPQLASDEHDYSLNQLRMVSKKMIRVLRPHWNYIAELFIVVNCFKLPRLI